MRDYRDAKTMAHALRDALQAKTVETTHSECLELIAKAFGYESWNILSAKIGTAPATLGHRGRTRRPNANWPESSPKPSSPPTSRA